MEEKSLLDSLSESEMEQFLVAKAQDIAFCRVPLWAFKLDLTRREQLVLGRIYSFQCTGNSVDPTKRRGLRMSLSKLADELGMANRGDALKVLDALVEKGYVTKQSNGPKRPASYFVDAAACLQAAMKSGFSI